MADGWASRGVSSTCWIVLNSFPVARHESRGAIVRGMIPGPSGLRPWPKHSLGSKLGPSLIVSPFHFECDRQAHTGQLCLNRECACSKRSMPSVTWYCLGEYHCRAISWRQELVLMPLPLFLIEHIPYQE